jgi:uncharacterized membrane protein YgcG
MDGSHSNCSSGTSSPALLTSATSASTPSSSSPLLPSPFDLLFVEAHHSKAGSFFCHLCRCALKRAPHALQAHLSGRRHQERSKAVQQQRFRVTLTLENSSRDTQAVPNTTAAAAGSEAGSSSLLTHLTPSSSRRLQLGLIPVLNLPAFWKACLLTLREQQQQLRMGHASNGGSSGVRGGLAGHVHGSSGGSGSGGAPLLRSSSKSPQLSSSGILANPLATLRLEEATEQLHPNVLKVKYMDGQKQ